MESVFFNLDDLKNKITYKFIAPDTTIFTTIGTTSAQSFSTTTNQFTLTPISPLYSQNVLPNEGKWSALSTNGNDILLAKTFVRPDVDRSYAIVALVKMNLNKLGVGVVAGTREPGGTQTPGPGVIPLPVQLSNNLIAAFNGGFQRKDGQYGMFVGNTVYLPLKQDVATFAIYTNGKPNIYRYTGQPLGGNILAIRQNGPMLIENGKIVTASSTWNMQTWGLTTTNSMYTWRSGIGVTKDDNLLYAAGPSLIPETLAKALLAGGAVSAMQLDINPVWVRFVLFQGKGNGKYDYYPLEPKMVNGGFEYLHGYQKDFFYVYKK